MMLVVIDLRDEWSDRLQDNDMFHLITSTEKGIMVHLYDLGKRSVTGG